MHLRALLVRRNRTSACALLLLTELGLLPQPVREPGVPVLQPAVLPCRVLTKPLVLGADVEVQRCCLVDVPLVRSPPIRDERPVDGFIRRQKNW
mgnify:CR=1 FL=1